MDQAERDRVHRPLAFDKMEGLVREMQDPETGVPVRSQKLFLTSIPSAFMGFWRNRSFNLTISIPVVMDETSQFLEKLQFQPDDVHTCCDGRNVAINCKCDLVYNPGYDLIEWLMERLNIEESVEAVHIANQLCNYGYFFPVSDSKNLVVKDDSSLYRFQTPYYWPWQNKSPDKVEYAIYLAKRTLRNKQRHGLEEYEVEALASLKKNLQNKWDFITMQAEEQVRLAKERKKGDKIVSDSQERAYWRVYRPPPGYSSCLESVPVPHRNRGTWQKKKTIEDLKKDVEFLEKCLSRTRIKVSAALENLMQYSETFMEYDSFFTTPQPSNPWLCDDPTFWQLNSPLVEVPTEKRVKRWALSMEDLVTDPTGLQEFTAYLRKQFSHENIRFWMAVNDLRRSSQAQIVKKVHDIFEEFLAPGAPCEINIDGKTMEKVHQEMKNPTRFTFDSAAEHVYTLLLKKDCYPRFIRSEHFKNLLAAGVQPSHKKRFFGFGGQQKKKSSTTAPAPNTALLQQQVPPPALSRRRGSDRSLSGSAHELAFCGVSGTSATRVTHSHSQSNLSDIPYRDPQGGSSDEAECTKRFERGDVCPWDSPVPGSSLEDKRKKLGTASCAGSMASEEVWEGEAGSCLTTFDSRISRKNSSQLDSGSSSSELSLAIVEVSDRLRRTCGIPQQSSLSGNEEAKMRKLSTTSGGKNESRRSSISAAHGEGCAKVSPDRNLPNPETKGKIPESSRPSLSSTEDVSVISPVTVAPTLPQQVTAIPQQPPTADTSLGKTKDDKAESEISRTFNKSQTGVRKKSLSTAPLISVSSVLEDDFAEAEETPPSVKNSEEPVKRDSAENPVEAKEAASEGDAPETSGGNSKDPVVCPWEDEDNCKVDAPFVKTYATLGYL